MPQGAGPSSASFCGTIYVWPEKHAFVFVWVFKNYEGPIVEFAKYGFLISLLVLMVCDASYKFYKGTSHRFIFPNKRS